MSEIAAMTFILGARPTGGVSPATHVADLATKQDKAANLTALAGIASGANKLPYFIGQNVLGTTDLTPMARALLDDAAAENMRATLGIDDFGLGTFERDFPGLDLNTMSNDAATGFYRYYATTMTGGPYGIQWGHVLHLRRATSGGVVQVFIAESPTAFAGEIYSRSRGSDGWNPWQRSYSNVNAIGKVGATDGVPNGALIETGSNSSGTYTRYADGTQICRFSQMTSIDGVSKWTFPAAFASSPDVVATPHSTVPGLVTTSSRTPTGIDVSGWGLDGVRRAFGAHCVAYGRWY